MASSENVGQKQWVHAFAYLCITYSMYRLASSHLVDGMSFSRQENTTIFFLLYVVKLIS